MERIATSAPGATGTFAIGEEAQLPVRGDPGLPATAASGRRSRSWLAQGVRIVRRAVVAVALMALVPLAIVATRGDDVWRLLANDHGLHHRAEIAEAVRPVALPKDPSTTPTQAGLAFTALLPAGDRQPGVSYREPASRPARSWEGMTLQPGMFATAPQWGIYAGPGSNRILEAAIKGLRPDEAAYLRAVATAPAWRAFDLVARAPSVDLFGAQYTSLGDVKRWEQLPVPAYKALRVMANAGISRAAWFLSTGQRDSAETALRAIVSFGFALIDNGATSLDQMTGNIIVATGREGLRSFYELTGDARAASAAVARPQASDGTGSAALAADNESPDESKRRLLARLADPRAPRSERVRAMRMLSLSRCTSVPKMLLGPGNDVADAIAKARRELARFPSEAPVMDLASRPWPVALTATYNDPVQMLKVSMASVAGSVIGNSQLATCTYIATGRYIP